MSSKRASASNRDNDVLNKLIRVTEPTPTKINEDVIVENNTTMPIQKNISKSTEETEVIPPGQDKTEPIHQQTKNDDKPIATDINTHSSQPTTSTNKATDKQTLKRQTYYLNDELIKALSVMAWDSDKDKSQLLRELLYKSKLKSYIGSKLEVSVVK